MKYTILLFSLISLTINVNAQCDQGKIGYTSSFDLCNNNPWVLVFEDNFNGNSLDLSKWDTMLGVPRDYSFSGQKAYHKKENAVTENGLLKIISKKENLIHQHWDAWLPNNIHEDHYDDFKYTSAEIWTKLKFEYGKFEARVKIPKGKGFFPAFWTFSSGPWNEIDIFEFWNENDLFNNYDPLSLSRVHHMTCHYDEGAGQKDCTSSYNGVDFSQDFHVFGMEWSPSSIKWYVDGVYKRVMYKHADMANLPVPCEIKRMYPYFYLKAFPKDPMAIIFNTAIQNGIDKYGNNDAPDSSTPFPSQMEVDWIRYYQQKPCQDVNITDVSQFPLSNEVFKALVGTKVNFNCNYLILPGQQLEIIAKNEINFGPGFNAELGSVFNARIDQSICSQP